MDKVKDLARPLKPYAEKVPQLVDLAGKIGQPVEVLLLGLIVVSGVVVLVLFGGTIFTLVLTVIYPAIQSIKAIESEGGDDDKEWLTYWTIFGLATLADEFAGFLLTFIPFYFYLRPIFFVFLMAPQTKGALFLYSNFVGPLLRNNKAAIQNFIDEIKGSAADISKAAKDEALKQVNDPSNMLKAAQMANQAQQQLNKLEG